MKKLTTAQFIDKACQKHGDKYDYSRVDYTDAKTPVKIICPEHGLFEQTPSNHLQGKGCDECAKKSRQEKLMKSAQEFIEQAKLEHDNKYNYSLVEYTGQNDKVIIICPQHGIFRQTPHNHLAGHGCPHCKGKEPNLPYKYGRKTNEQFVKEAIAKHGNKYDYSKIKYVNAKTKVCIICSIHGEFWQTPDKHLHGQGCPCCYGTNKKTIEKFIFDARKVHGNKYDYSQVVYKNNHTKVKIICPIHGEFEQTPSNHLKGKGCASCSGNKILTKEQFVEQAREVHGNKYDYSQVEYVNMKTKINIVCPKHGLFSQTPSDHMRSGCIECGKIQAYDTAKKNGTISRSWQEQDVLSIIRLLVSDLKVLSNDRQVVSSGIEYDIVIPDLKIAIEYNGLYWHSNLYKDNNYHYNKYIKAKESGYQLITIWEDDWLNHRDIVIEMLAYKLHAVDNLSQFVDDELFCETVFARKLHPQIVDTRDAYEFLDKTHIQGRTTLTKAYGLVDDDGNIRALLGVRSPRQNARMKRAPGEWEIQRYATLGHIPGGFSKLMKFAEKDLGNDITSWISFSDNCVSDGSMYEACGFIKDKEIRPDYKYVGSFTGMKRRPKEGFQKRKFKENPNLIYYEGLTERELAELNDLYRVYDAGKIRWIKKVGD